MPAAEYLTDMPLSDMIEEHSESSTPSPSPIEREEVNEEETPCAECGKRRSRRCSIASNPASTKAGRVYYPCTNMKCSKGSKRMMERDFVVWDTHGELPRCDCGLPSRQGLMGRDGIMPGYGYWTCAYGKCSYFSRDRKGRSLAKGEVDSKKVQPFIPWLLNAN